ncbi:DUF5688 family protein [Pseudobutyrivibrio xylanivorans]|uniref:Uncharacterized protein n=1 Tax=Pseudobutyrivibrio xylanivorans DSM 14809 TaxID=1123012 RepID=A0A1M6BEA6_PSEXY|nr:DUF5688 family protein [Pseudobutyrivibrio xylanivorans]SHI47072.1 hypothetical protein SAMN02745725_00435 [Pseudobutyrivibrio xylanivorans DSM 14809]
MTYKKINKNIVFKLINKDKNAEFLETVPYKEYLDFAVVFYIVQTNDDDTLKCMVITNELMASWGIEVDALMNLSLENTPRLLGLKIRGILSTIASYTDSEELQSVAEEEDNDLPLYVATNNIAMHGAAVLLYRDLLKAFAARKKSDVYIIPCSVHELIMIPSVECPNVDPQELKNLIYHVNRNELKEDEFLSDNLYFYSVVDDEVTIVQ